MKLYEISEKFQYFFDKAHEEILANDCISEESAAILENLNLNFDEKADNLACMIKNLKSEAEAIKKEINILKERQKQKENCAEKLMEYLKAQMKFIGKVKVESARNKIQIRKNPESVRDSPEFVE